MNYIYNCYLNGHIRYHITTTLHTLWHLWLWYVHGQPKQWYIDERKTSIVLLKHRYSTKQVREIPHCGFQHINCAKPQTSNNNRHVNWSRLQHGSTCRPSAPQSQSWLQQLRWQHSMFRADAVADTPQSSLARISWKPHRNRAPLRWTASLLWRSFRVGSSVMVWQTAWKTTKTRLELTLGGFTPLTMGLPSARQWTQKTL